MKRLSDNACRVTVKNTGPNDTGTWKFTMQDGHGNNRKLKQYNHIVNIQILGNILLSKLTDDNICKKSITNKIEYNYYHSKYV